MSDLGCPNAPHAHMLPVCLDAPICLDTPYVWIPPVCLDAPTPLDAHTFGGHPNLGQIIGDVQMYRMGIQTYEGHPNIWECPNIWGCPNIWACPNIQRVSKHMGTFKHTGASKHRVASKYMGASEHTGGVQMYGGIQIPPSLTKHAFFVLYVALMPVTESQGYHRASVWSWQHFSASCDILSYIRSLTIVNSLNIYLRRHTIALLRPICSK